MFWDYLFLALVLGVIALVAYWTHWAVIPWNGDSVWESHRLAFHEFRESVAFFLCVSLYIGAWVALFAVSLWAWGDMAHP